MHGRQPRLPAARRGLAALTSGHVDAWDVWSPYIEQAVGQDHARILVNGTGYGAPYSFAVASRAALADPAKAAAIRDYLKLLNQAYVWAARTVGLGHGLGQGHRPAGHHHAEGGPGRRRTPVQITPAVVSAEQSVANAFTASGLIPGHVDFANFSRTSFNDTVGGVVMSADIPLVPAHHRRRPGDHGPGAQPAAGRRGGPAGRPDAPHIRGAAAQERPPDIEYLAQVARSAEQLGLRGGADPDRHLVRGRVAGHRRADPGDQPPEVPGRVPARADLPHPGRPDGRHLPAAVRRPAAAQRGDRGPGRRAAAVRRLPVPRRAVRPDRRSSWPSSAARGAASRSTSTASTTRCEGATVLRPPDPVPGVYFGGSSPAAGRWRPPPRTST